MISRWRAFLRRRRDWGLFFRRSRRGASNLRPGLAEDRTIAGDCQVTEELDLVSATDAPTVHLRDQRLGAGEDRLGETLKVFHKETSSLSIQPLHLADVSPDAKGFFPRTSKNNHADRPVFYGACDRLRRLDQGLVAKCVEFLRAVERDGRDPVCAGVGDVLIGHGEMITAFASVVSSGEQCLLLPQREIRPAGTRQRGLSPPPSAPGGPIRRNVLQSIS